MSDDWRFRYMPDGPAEYQIEHVELHLRMRGPRPTIWDAHSITFFITYPDDDRTAHQAIIRELFPTCRFSPRGSYAYVSENDFAMIKLAAS